MHPHLTKAINEIDAAMINGDVFEDPGERADMIEWLERWCKRLSEPYFGTKPPVFEAEWGKVPVLLPATAVEAVETLVRFGFDMANKAHARGYVEADEPEYQNIEGCALADHLVK